MRISHRFNRNHQDLLHHQLVHMHQGTRMTTEIINSRAQPTQSQGNMAQWDTWTPKYAKCGRNHPGACRDGSNGYFKCGQMGHFMREFPKNSRAMGSTESNLLQ
uniref:Gag-pol protein n=1 Tax=Solanum tuberosum TaxID=4113 RepID=M1DMP5_SOLTU